MGMYRIDVLDVGTGFEKIIGENETDTLLQSNDNSSTIDKSIYNLDYCS